MRSRKPSGAGAAWGVLIVALVVLGSRFETKRVVRLGGQGVFLEEIVPGKVPRGDKARARVGDFVLATDTLQIAIGATTEDARRRLAHGALVDATISQWEDDAIRSIRTTASAGGGRLAVRTTTVDARMVGGAPGIRVQQSALGGRLRLMTQYRLRSGDPGSSCRPGALRRGAEGPDAGPQSPGTM